MVRVDWTVVKVPYGGGYCSLNLVKPKGTKRAPDALQKEFNRQSIFMADNGVSSWSNVLWKDADVLFRFQNSVDIWNIMNDYVSRYVFDVYRDSVSIGNYTGKFLFLGGSHSITASTYATIAQMNGRENTGLIVLDAHPDCCDKADWPIHSDWLRWLLTKNKIFSENIIVIGLRQMEKSEKEFLDKFNINYYRMSNINDPGNLTTNYFSVMRALEKLRKLAATYISIDIDVASAAYAPGTGCPSPGGFADTELISLVKQLKVALPNLKAADIVEINPLNWWRKRILRYDPTVDLGVKLIKEIIS